MNYPRKNLIKEQVNKRDTKQYLSVGICKHTFKVCPSSSDWHQSEIEKDSSNNSAKEWMKTQSYTGKNKAMSQINKTLFYVCFTVVMF